MLTGVRSTVRGPCATTTGSEPSVSTSIQSWVMPTILPRGPRRSATETSSGLPGDRRSVAGARQRADDQPQHPDSAGLVQRVVAVAALRRLHARRAAASGTRTPRSPPPSPPANVAACRKPRARRTPHRRGGRRRRTPSAGRPRADRGGQPADVTAVATGHQRQQSDRGMLGGVQRSRDPQMDRFRCRCNASGVIVYITATVSRVCVGMSSSTKSITSPAKSAAQVADDGVRYRHRAPAPA